MSCAKSLMLWGLTVALWWREPPEDSQPWSHSLGGTPAVTHAPVRHMLRAQPPAGIQSLTISEMTKGGVRPHTVQHLTCRFPPLVGNDAPTDTPIVLSAVEDTGSHSVQSFPSAATGHGAHL